MVLRVNIDYADGKPGAGPGVFVVKDDRMVENWNSGDPVQDWSAFMDWAKSHGETVEYGTSITRSAFALGLAEEEGWPPSQA